MVILNLPFPLKSPSCHRPISDSADDGSAISLRKAKGTSEKCIFLFLLLMLIDTSPSPLCAQLKAHFSTWGLDSIPSCLLNEFIILIITPTIFTSENKDNNALSHQKWEQKTRLLYQFGVLTISKRNQFRVTYRKKNGIHWKDTGVIHSIAENAEQPSLPRAEHSES